MTSNQERMRDLMLIARKPFGAPSAHIFMQVGTWWGRFRLGGRAALRGSAALAVAVTTTTGRPTFAAQDDYTSPPNEPRAIVQAIIARDLKNLGRHSGWQYLEYTPLFESFPPYTPTRVVNSNGTVSVIDEVSTFGRCAQTMLVNSIKVKDVINAPDPTSPVGQPKALANEVLVIVQAEVVALRLLKPDAIPVSDRCSWLGLEVRNTKTGKRESYFDNVDDDQALLQMMKQFGEVKGNYVIVEPHRRHWEYAISMRLPRTGKGLRRHYNRDAEIGKRDWVDAIEPRWLIQEPYPPEAWHVRTAVKNIERVMTNVRNGAIPRACGFAMARAHGVSPNSVKPNLADPACKTSKSVQEEMQGLQVLADELELLRQIERESKK